jgi:hypothetical protein
VEAPITITHACKRAIVSHKAAKNPLQMNKYKENTPHATGSGGQASSNTSKRHRGKTMAEDGEVVDVRSQRHALVRPHAFLRAAPLLVPPHAAPPAAASYSSVETASRPPALWPHALSDGLFASIERCEDQLDNASASLARARADARSAYGTLTTLQVGKNRW